jgi:hypothetical protein
VVSRKRGPRFTPQGGSWSIDDVYVDPHHSG